MFVYTPQKREGNRFMRGYQKRVIYVKNTGSRHFEEAYFVMRSDCDGAAASPDSMILEANRIINENFKKRKGGFFYSKRWYFLTFFAGCALTFLLCFLAGILF